MSIVAMKKLRLIAVQSQKKALLEDLLKLGCVQVSESEADLEGLMNTLGDKRDEGAMERRSQQIKILNALKVLDQYAPVKKGLLTPKPEAEKEAFLDEQALHSGVEAAEHILALDAEIRAAAASESRERALLESLEPWAGMDLPLECRGTKTCDLLLGAVPASVTVMDVNGRLAELDAVATQINADPTDLFITVLYRREQRDEVLAALRDVNFSQVTFPNTVGTAKDNIALCKSRLDSLAEKKTETAALIKAEGDKRSLLEMSADAAGTGITLGEAAEKLGNTDSIAFLEGWTPAEKEEELKQIFQRYDCAYELLEPMEEEYPEVPVKLKNNAFTNALNMVTNMYSLPAYGTVDPNPLMAPFFILFFGLMMADIGYGALLIIAGLVARKKLKPRGNALATWQLVLYGGISTLICGILTGGCFSDVIDRLCELFGSSFRMPYLFSAEKQSTAVLVGSMVLGLLHLNTGMAVSFHMKRKAGNLADGIFEEGSLWVILLGGVLFALPMLPGLIGASWTVPAILGTVGKVILIVGIVMLLFGAGRHSKGFGKVTAAFGAIYNTATGWFGDVLSYSRIMALMLAGGVVGKVFNNVALMPAVNKGHMTFGTGLVFIIIFVLGHTMNFGLNILGCYVHDLRLQCLEFFGKFYQDGGKPFRPLSFSETYHQVREQ